MIDYLAAKAVMVTIFDSPSLNFRNNLNANSPNTYENVPFVVINESIPPRTGGTNYNFVYGLDTSKFKDSSWEGRSFTTNQGTLSKVIVSGKCDITAPNGNYTSTLYSDFVSYEPNWVSENIGKKGPKLELKGNEAQEYGHGSETREGVNNISWWIYESRIYTEPQSGFQDPLKFDLGLFTIAISSN